MDVIQINTRNRQQVKQFLRLPFHIYRDIPQWVPPLQMDMRRMLDQRRHPFYQHSHAAFFIAEADFGQPIGRLAILDNRHYNQYNHEKTAFFYLFECINDLGASQALFDAGFAWARKRGLAQVIGPKGFTALDGMGLLVHGYEHRPALGIPYNLDYYAQLIEAAGFLPLNDVVSGYLRADFTFPEKIHQLAALVKQRRGLHIAQFQSRRDLRILTSRLQSLYNAALEGTTGNTPLTQQEARMMADQILWFADPRLIKLVMKDDQPVGFLFAYPDISAAIQRTQGRAFPFGWISLLREMRHTPWVNINGAGMLKGYRGLGGTAILFSEMQQSIMKGGFKHADLVQIGVENENMQRELRHLGVEFYKTHRVYRRTL